MQAARSRAIGGASSGVSGIGIIGKGSRTVNGQSPARGYSTTRLTMT